MDAKEALKLFKDAKEYWQPIYNEAHDDLRFSIGEDHWSQKDLQRRGAEACLVINQLPQFIHQVVNDMRQNTPAINVIPADDDADIETAKIFKGLIRNIEYRSNADIAYDTSGEYAVRCGIGFVRVDHDYVNDKSFDQELLIKAVPNPLSVYIDPASIEPDGSDANYAVALDVISKKEFERKYPDRDICSFTDEGKEDRKADDESVVIAEVFVREYEDKKMMLGADGEIVPFVDSDNSKDAKTRTIRKTIIRRYKFSGEGEPLEETTFPGKYIPVIPEYGEVVYVDGKRKCLSLIRQSKDAQRRLNHWASKEQEILTLAPVAPILAAAGQTEDFDEWTDPDNAAVLRYKAEDALGNPVPMPQRLAPPPVPTGIVNAMQGAKENIKETMGLYNASIGNRSNEVSGKAINARKVEGDVATFHFPDNRIRTIQQVGRVIAAAIPEVYDTGRIISIIDEEESTKRVSINGAPMLQDQASHYDLTKGEYDIRVTVGASYTTKRQEAADLLGEAIKSHPELLNIIGDLYFKNLDVAGAEAIAERMKKTINPALIEGENGQEPTIDPEKQQMAQIIEQLQGQMQQMAAELQNKQGDAAVKAAELEIKSKELDIKNRELELKAMDAMNGSKSADLTVDPAKAEELRLKEIETMSRIQLERDKLALEVQKTLLDATRTLETSQTIEPKEPSENGENEESAQHEMLEAQQRQEQNMMLQSIVQALAALQETISQPINVIRDENGVITGAA